MSASSFGFARTSPVHAVRLIDHPVPVWVLNVSDPHPHRPPLDERQLVDLDARLPLCAFRGVSIERLATVLRTGVDVDPTDAPIYVSDLDKAWEYGGFPKLVLALDRRSLDRTFRELPSASSADERRAVRKTFPTVLEGIDGDTLWFSRLAPDDPGITKPYEVEYARWIPGDPFEALRAMLVFASNRDLDALTRAWVEALGTSEQATSAD